MDPLTCPKCFSEMRVISVIEDEEIIKKILKHIGLWNRKARPPPEVTPGKTQELYIDYTDSQLPASDDYLYVEPEPAYT